MPTILCIDDQAEGLLVRKAMLESKGYTVLTAKDGPAGIKLVRTHHPDAVVLDSRMPGMDGEQVALFLKENYPALPIILLSGWPNIPATLLAMVDGFVQKGEPVAVLLSALNAIIESRSTQHPAPARRIRFG